jgi:serine O-acetyltransferase
MSNALDQRYSQVLAEALSESSLTIGEQDDLWELMREEAQAKAAGEPILGSYFHATILNHETFGSALSFRLASKLDNPMLPTMLIRDVIKEAAADDPNILRAAEIDMLATYSRDPACTDLSTPFLFYKGFHALQAHRVAHWLWNQERHSLAFYFQNQMSAIFGVDIHPAARIGCGIMFDHATGIVIGETTVVEDDVTMLHGVTLGGTGKDQGDRHPKVRHGVLIGAAASIIGNIEIGEGAKVGAGSVVMKDVPPHVTVAGVPAEIIGTPASDLPAEDVDQSF